MLDAAQTRRLAENLASVRDRIELAAKRSGRDAGDVRLVGVTKYVCAEVAAALVNAGLVDLGESRPQELWRKREQLEAPAVRWHFVGHLQRNKLRRTLPLISLLHAGDSLRLLEAISQEAVSLQTVVDVLLEVNVSGDASKQGFAPDSVEASLAELAKLPGVRIIGLMGMAALEGGRVVAQRNFADLRSLRDRLQKSAPNSMQLSELSMGMSDDFDLAIEEGATLVRVGSALFEGLTLPNDL